MPLQLPLSGLSGPKMTGSNFERSGDGEALELRAFAANEALVRRLVESALYPGRGGRRPVSPPAASQHSFRASRPRSAV